MSRATPDVVFLCSGLNFPGGTERAIVNTAHLLQQNGHKVCLLILNKTTKSFYPVDSAIEVRNLKLHFGLTESGNAVTRKWLFAKHVLRLRNELQSIAAPVVVATDYVYAIAARMGFLKNFRLYAWEHHSFGRLYKNRFWTFLFKRFYPTLSGVICLNETEAALYNGIGCRTIVIPNFIERQPQPAQLFQKRILTVGRLTVDKGSDRIPAIAHGVLKKFPHWKWTIIGDGAEHGVLKKFIEENGLELQLEIILPTTSDLSKDYLSASIYVLLSRHECFPMVLLEAMSAGVPCIAFDCPTGPAHIIRHGEDGLLVENENVDEMIASITNLIENEETRKRFGDAAFSNGERFAPEKIYQLWKRLLIAE